MSSRASTPLTSDALFIMTCFACKAQLLLHHLHQKIVVEEEEDEEENRSTAIYFVCKKADTKKGDLGPSPETDGWSRALILPFGSCEDFCQSIQWYFIAGYR